MKEISDLLERDIVKSYISKKFSFDDIQAAHLQIEQEKQEEK